MKSDNLIQISGYLTKDASCAYDKQCGCNVLQVRSFTKDRKLPTDLLLKGKEVFVKGSLRLNNYTKDGVAYSGFQIVAEKIRNANE